MEFVPQAVQFALDDITVKKFGFSLTLVDFNLEFLDVVRESDCMLYV